MRESLKIFVRTFLVAIGPFCYVKGEANLARAQDAIAPSVPSAGKVAPNDSETSEPKPHAWIADAPPSLARLISLGHVRIQIDDETVRRERKSALTLFHFRTEYELRYFLRVIDRDDSGNRITKVSVRFLKPTLTFEHDIKLTSSYRPTRPWNSRLLLHEMDHVAISSDPRLSTILNWLQYAPLKLEMTLPADNQQDADQIKQEIERRLVERRGAVQSLVQSYYQRLDESSQNGTLDLKDRSRFFMNLYSTEDLEESKFLFLSDVRQHLEKINLEKITMHYLIDPPIREN